MRRSLGCSLGSPSKLLHQFCNVLVNYLGGLGGFFLLCIKNALLPMQGLLEAATYFAIVSSYPKAIENSSGSCFIYKFVWVCVLSVWMGGRSSVLWFGAFFSPPRKHRTAPLNLTMMAHNLSGTILLHGK